MNRQQKETIVSDFEKLFVQSPATFLVNYKGLSVAQMQLLRRKLREDGGFLRVTKARLMKIAAQKGSQEFGALKDFQEDFKNQIGLVFSQGEEVSAIAKKLIDFSKKNVQLEVLSGFFESKVLTQADIKLLAALPSREVLLAMLAGTMQAPIAGFVRLLNQLIVRLLYVLKQIAEKQEKSS